jgi:hypothetical protein
MRLLHDYVATLHVHSAGKADSSGFLRCELHNHRLVERKFAFDFVVGYHNVRRTGHFNLADERQSHGNVLADGEARRGELVFSDGYVHSLGLGRGA